MPLKKMRGNVLHMNRTTLFTDIDNAIRDITNAKLQKKLEKLKTIVLEKLDPEYHAIVSEIIDLYSYDARTVLKLSTGRRIRSKREIDSDVRCMARIGLGNQCSRSRTSKTVFCKSHDISRPYGRIDVAEQSEQKIAKRRGRRSKTDKAYSISDLDMSLYVQAILIYLNNEPFLMDQNNVLYQYNSNNEIVGQVVDDKVVWY